MSSEVVTTVVIFLPLSSLWASASIQGRISGCVRKKSQLNLLGDISSNSTDTGASKKRVDSQCVNLRQLSESPVSSPRAAVVQGTYPDIEAQDPVNEK